MRTLLNASAGAAISIAAIIFTSSSALAAATLASARIESRGATQELHFGFDRAAPRFILSAHGTALQIDLGRARIAIPPRPLFGYEAPPIESVRAIESDGGASRVVVEVTGKADFAAGRVGREIILRIAPAGADPNIAAPILIRHRAIVRRPAAIRQAAAPIQVRSQPITPGPPAIRQVVARAPIPEFRDAAPAPVSPPAAHRESAAPAIGKGVDHPLVMIDPGHGGYDPGTQSAAGVAEKDVALAISMRLKTALEARGIHAKLTRDSDEFVSLADRTKIANRAGADLFVSIHLNSSPNPDTAGIEVYYLNNTTDRAAIRLARMENGADPAYGAQRGPNLNYILADLRQNYKAEESASIAAAIDARTVAALDAGFGLNVTALGAKRGPFYVLVGAHMPAVLAECGFMSNAEEAARLSSPRYQDTIAGGIAAAAADYFDADLAVGNL